MGKLEIVGWRPDYFLTIDYYLGSVSCDVSHHLPLLFPANIFSNARGNCGILVNIPSKTLILRLWTGEERKQFPNLFF